MILEKGNFNFDCAFSEKFYSEIKEICGRHLFKDASFKDDTQKATDLILSNTGDIRIGVRIRRFDAYLKYPDDLTIRSERSSGAETELSKYRKGYGSYMIYAFTDKQEKYIIKWIIIDLNVFRKNEPEILYIQANNPPTEKFAVYDTNTFSPELVVAKSQENIENKENNNRVSSPIKHSTLGNRDIKDKSSLGQGMIEIAKSGWEVLENNKQNQNNEKI